MNLSKIKRLAKKNLPIIFVVIAIIIVIIINLIFPKNISKIIFLSIFAITIVIRIIIEIIYITKRIRRPINNKIDTIKEVYKLFDLENDSTVVAISTKDENIAKEAKKQFPISSITKHKKIYNVLIPNAKSKNIIEFIKNQEPERIIIHHAKKPAEGNDKGRSISICIDKNLTIRFNKNTYTKEEIQDIREKIKK